MELLLLVLGVCQRDLVSDLFDSLLDLRLVALTLKHKTISMATSHCENVITDKRDLWLQKFLRRLGRDNDDPLLRLVHTWRQCQWFFLTFTNAFNTVSSGAKKIKTTDEITDA